MGHDLLINKNKSLIDLFSSSSHMELGYLLPPLVDMGLDKKLESALTQRLNNHALPIPAKEMSEAILVVCKSSKSKNELEQEQYMEILSNALQLRNLEVSKEEHVFDLETKLLVRFFGDKLEKHPIFRQEKLEKISIFGEPAVEIKSVEYKLPSIETMNPLSTIQWLIENKNIEEIYKNTEEIYRNIEKINIYSTVLKARQTKLNPLNIFSKKPEPTLREGAYTLLLRIALMRQIQIAFDFQRYSYELRSST